MLKDIVDTLVIQHIKDTFCKRITTANVFNLTDVPLYEEGKLNFLSITLGILLAVSLFSLWLIKLVRRRNDHMSNLYSLLDTHFAEGEKLLDEYRHTIS